MVVVDVGCVDRYVVTRGTLGHEAVRPNQQGALNVIGWLV